MVTYSSIQGNWGNGRLFSLIQLEMVNHHIKLTSHCLLGISISNQSLVHSLPHTHHTPGSILGNTILPHSKSRDCNFLNIPSTTLTVGCSQVHRYFTQTYAHTIQETLIVHGLCNMFIFNCNSFLHPGQLGNM